MNWGIEAGRTPVASRGYSFLLFPQGGTSCSKRTCCKLSMAGGRIPKSNRHFYPSKRQFAGSNRHLFPNNWTAFELAFGEAAFCWANEAFLSETASGSSKVCANHLGRDASRRRVWSGFGRFRTWSANGRAHCFATLPKLHVHFARATLLGRWVDLKKTCASCAFV